MNKIRRIKVVQLIVILLMVFSCGQKDSKQILNAAGKSFSEKSITNFFINLMDSLEMPGLSVAIINDAEIVYQKVFGTKMVQSNELIDNTTFFEAASLSKPLFAFFCMKQHDKGILDLDRPLYQYLPYPDIEYDERYRAITSRMILAHTSGFPNWRADSLTIDFKPGTQYQYSGEGYRYLANVLAKINELPIEQLDHLFQKEVVSELGLSRLYFKWNEEIANNKATGHINGQQTDNFEVRKDLHFGSAGGLHADAVSYANFLIAIMKKKGLTEQSYSEMLKEQIKLPKEDINAILLNASAWSLGFGIIPNPKDMCYWHSGNNEDFQSWFHFYPERKYGMVVFTNSDKIQTPEFFTSFFNFFDDGITFDISKLQ